MTMIPARSSRVFSTDTTCFLAIESIFTKASGDARDPEAFAVATSLFDAIVNASELRLCLAVGKEEKDYSGRLSHGYKDVFSKLAKLGGHNLHLPIVTIPNSPFEARSDYVLAA